MFENADVFDLQLVIRALAPQLLGGIVTGIGFLGAGMIVHDQGAVHGLTSAAAIWAIAAVGMVTGSGELVMGVLLAALVLLVLAWRDLPGTSRISHRSGLRPPSTLDWRDPEG